MITQLSETDAILASYRSALGDDFDRYRGHCYRLINYIGCFGMTQSELTTCSVVVPFHDIGVWTHRTMNYLEVSAELAVGYVNYRKLPVNNHLVRDMIVNHHKLTSTSGGLSEKLRRADLVDLTGGIVRFGIARSVINQASKLFPYRGFQLSIYQKVMRYAFHHILNPLPMLKI